jgi:hypothetical protein
MMIANFFRACYSVFRKAVARMGNKTNKPTFEFAALEPNERLREMILYISKRLHGDLTLGKTKLNKILFFADFFSYLKNGEPVTGTAYKKDEFGPVPANINMVLEQMKSAGEIAEGFLQRGSFKQKVIMPKRAANLAIFTEAQIAAVEDVIVNLTGYTNGDVSELSHKRIWRVARMGELIPYEAAFLSDKPLTDYEIKRTRELCTQYGWEN